MNEIKDLKKIVFVIIGVLAVVLAFQNFRFFLLMLGGVIVIEGWEWWNNRK